MKSRLCFAISLVLCFAGPAARACWCGGYSPRDYMMYRAYADYLTGRVPEPDFNYDARENCLLWQAQTGGKATLEDIYHVVYKVTPDEFCRFPRIKGGKTFVNALRADRRAFECLFLAKRCEDVRARMASPWWYPSKEDPETATLEDIVEEAGSYRSGRFHGRYVLQGLRALFSLHRFDDCINWWNEVEAQLPDDVIKRMAMRYVAGAYWNVGEEQTARVLYGRAGDVKSLLFCMRDEKKSEQDAIYEYCPDSRDLRTFIEQKIINYSRWKDSVWEDSAYRSEQKAAFMPWAPWCERIAGEGRVSDPEFWYYSAAYIWHLCDDDRKADALLRKAERCAEDETLRESIHVFRIYLDAVLTPWSGNYEAQMVERLRWLDGKIVEHKAEAAGVAASSGIYLMRAGISFYYWNDTMRKIVLGVICPRLVEHGHGAEAIAFANMADNRLLNLVGQIEEHSYDRVGKRYVERTAGYVLADYRHHAEHNDYDYGNALFALLDTVRTDQILYYLHRLDAPLSEADRFLNARGYGNRAFFREVYATRLLRDMRYREADKWFEKVPKEHMRTLNTYRCGYFGVDPFSIVRKAKPNKPGWKHDFAKEMSRLQDVIRTEQDPDKKALAMVRYATGVQNSVTTCWALTFYSRYWGDDDPLYGESLVLRARKRPFYEAEKYYRMALCTAKSRETLASIHYAMRNLETVMRDFPETSVAKSLEGKCDNYLDFHLENRKYYNCNIWIEQ